MVGKRAQVRAELTAEILASARRQVAAEGAGQLSLRAIARELGMASSAIYRYFSSRDELLTALLVESYNELGSFAERADAAYTRNDVLGRWAGVGRAAYEWATANPAQYALLFGTPVPGYAAPADTIGPASRFTGVLLDLLAAGEGQGRAPVVQPVIAASTTADLHQLRTMTGATVSDSVLLAGVQAWTALFGLISFIVFGQLDNVIGDHDAFFASASDLIGRQVFGTG
jgi:AcrR family transcriptional regulator